MGKSVEGDRAGVGEAEGIGGESTGTAAKKRRNNDTMTAMINLKWARMHCIRWGDNGKG